MLDWLTSQLTMLAVAASAAIMLRTFYAEFESRWPEHYFGGDNGVDPVVSRTPLRYLVFRLAPVLAALVVAGVVGSRLGESRWIVIVYGAALHLLGGPIRGLVRSLMAAPPRFGLATYRAAGILAVILATGVALWIDDRADDLVPTLDEFATAIWTGVAVVALSRLARSLTARQPNADELLRRAREDLDPSLLQRLADNERYAVAYQAIAYAEHLNRPAWVRRIERFVLRRGGSYGLMQTTSPRPLTDDESVSVFLERAAAYPALSEDPDAGQLREFFLAHNDDGVFADLAVALYWELRSQ